MQWSWQVQGHNDRSFWLTGVHGVVLPCARPRYPTLRGPADVRCRPRAWRASPPGEAHRALEVIEGASEINVHVASALPPGARRRLPTAGR